MKKRLCEHEKEHSLAIQRAKEKGISGGDIEKVCKIFQLLSEPSRFKIVLALMQGDMCVCHLQEVCEGTASAVSHQLRVLRDNGVIKAKRLGQNVEYSIWDEHIREIVEKGIAHLRCEA